jgi:hypothetical protein
MSLFIKNAIAVALFAQRASSVADGSVQSGYFACRFTAQFRNSCDLVIIDPHIARLTRATIAATSATKPQPVLIPWFGHPPNAPYGR